MTRTLTLFRSARLWCGERKSSHGKSSENAHDLHDMNELRVLLEKGGNEKKRMRMAIVPTLPLYKACFRVGSGELRLKFILTLQGTALWRWSWSGAEPRVCMSSRKPHDPPLQQTEPTGNRQTIVSVSPPCTTSTHFLFEPVNRNGRPERQCSQSVSHWCCVRLAITGL